MPAKKMRFGDKVTHIKLGIGVVTETKQGQETAFDTMVYFKRWKTEFWVVGRLLKLGWKKPRRKAK